MCPVNGLHTADGVDSSRTFRKNQQRRQPSGPSNGIPDVSDLVSRIPLLDQIDSLPFFLRRQLLLRIQIEQALVRGHDECKRIRQDTDRRECRGNAKVANEVVWSRVCCNGVDCSR